MDKLLYAFGSILSGFNVTSFAIRHDLFGNLPNAIFTCVCIVAIAVLGGASMLLFKDFIYEKAWKQKK